jgi:hypothetical protein
MAEIWYYTSEGKQMDAVSIKELKRLVAEGTLKPTDMVWKDGMARWIRASSLKELYPDPMTALDHYFTHTRDAPPRPSGPVLSTAVTAEEGSRAKSVPIDDREELPRKKKKSRPTEDRDEDDRPQRKRTGGSGMGLLILIGAILGAGALFGALAVGVAILIFMVQSDAPAPPRPPRPPVAVINPAEKAKEPPKIEPKQELKKELLPPDVKVGSGIVQPAPMVIFPGKEFSFHLRVKAGFKARVTVTNKVLNKKLTPDINLHVLKEDGTEIVSDVRPDADAMVEFTVPMDQTVRVRVVNASKWLARSTISYDGG